MNYVTLSNGLQLPQIGFGTFPLKGKQLTVALRTAAANNYELIDTAIGYGNHVTIGEAVGLNVLLDKCYISTKIDGYTLRKMLLPRIFKRFANNVKLSRFIDKGIIEKAIRNSFSELGRIDILLLHAPYTGCMKLYDSIMDLYEEKKIKAYGVSNFNIDELKDLKQRSGAYPMINQIELSPYNSQKELVDFCNNNDIIVEAYSPFGRGNLVQEFMQNKDLQKIGSNYGKTVGQVILRWVVQQGLVAIVRSQNADRIKENSQLFDFQLSKSEMEQIDALNRNMVFGYNTIGKKTVKL